VYFILFLVASDCVDSISIVDIILILLTRSYYNIVSAVVDADVWLTHTDRLDVGLLYLYVLEVLLKPVFEFVVGHFKTRSLL